MARWIRFLLAVIAGAAMALAFPPFGASILAPLAVAALTYALWQQSARMGAALAAVAGLVFFAILLRWVALVGTDAWLALSAFCALWFALLGAASAMLSNAETSASRASSSMPAVVAKNQKGST